MIEVTPGDERRIAAYDVQYARIAATFQKYESAIRRSPVVRAASSRSTEHRRRSSSTRQ